MRGVPIRRPIGIAGCLVLCAVAATAQSQSTAMRRSTGFTSNQLFPCDDGDPTVPEDVCTPDPLVPQSIGFTVNFFGLQQDTVFINNNGNVTFDAPLFDYTPFNLTTTDRLIIAPFFGDVDTRAPGSNVVTYGTDFVDGHKAFAVSWDGVGYFALHDVPLNRFQVVFIEREDLAPGDFDMEFNYETVGWDAGDFNGGINGIAQGGESARVGFAHAPTTALELPGSGVAAAFLDSSTTTGLIFNSQGSATPGRYAFRIRSGVVLECQDDVACDDGNPCTTDVCDRRLDQLVGECTHAPVTDGEPCDDGSACTTNACSGGTCQVTAEVVCDPTDQCHDPGSCDPQTGVCSTPAKANGSGCDDGNACTQSDSCQAGSCVGSNPVVCTAIDACHLAGTCDPDTGFCSNPLVNAAVCTVSSTSTTSTSSTSTTTTTKTTTSSGVPTTTSTLTAGGCDTEPEAATFRSIDCRLSALLDRVDGTPALGVFGPKLAQDLGRARDNEEAAQEFCATSNLKRARQRLKQALDATMQYGHHLSTRAARKKLPLTLQQDFLGAGVPIENDLKTLKTAVHCPSDAAG